MKRRPALGHCSPLVCVLVLALRLGLGFVHRLICGLVHRCLDIGGLKSGFIVPDSRVSSCEIHSDAFDTGHRANPLFYADHA